MHTWTREQWSHDLPTTFRNEELISSFHIPSGNSSRLESTRNEEINSSDSLIYNHPTWQTVPSDLQGINIAHPPSTLISLDPATHHGSQLLCYCFFPFLRRCCSWSEESSTDDCRRCRYVSCQFRGRTITSCLYFTVSLLENRVMSWPFQNRLFYPRPIRNTWMQWRNLKRKSISSSWKWLQWITLSAR